MFGIFKNLCQTGLYYATIQNVKKKAHGDSSKSEIPEKICPRITGPLEISQLKVLSMMIVMKRSNIYTS